MKRVLSFERVGAYSARRQYGRHETGHKLSMTLWNGVVEVFTHDGSKHSPAFTCVEYHSNCMIYHGRISRCYDRRWLARVAHEFVQLVELIDEGKAA